MAAASPGVVVVMRRALVVALSLFATACICPPGGYACDGACVDLRTDPRHCGRCGAFCGAGLVCTNGDCVEDLSCSSDAECDDFEACTGVERCVSGRCVAGTAMVCDDGIGCTRNQCSGGRCRFTPDDARCGGEETCVGEVARPSGCVLECAEEGCDPVEQCGCLDGEGCYAETGPPACQPAGSEEHGEPCDAALCSPGNACVDADLGFTNRFYCRRACNTDEDCDEGGTCSIQLASGLRVCTDACDLAAHTGCPAPLGCHPTGPLSERVADCAYIGDSEVGDPCTTHDTCPAGSICVIFGEGRCSSICRVDGDCPSFDCARLMTPVIVDGVEYGACR